MKNHNNNNNKNRSERASQLNPSHHPSRDSSVRFVSTGVDVERSNHRKTVWNQETYLIKRRFFFCLTPVIRACFYCVRSALSGSENSFRTIFHRNLFSFILSFGLSLSFVRVETTDTENLHQLQRTQCICSNYTCVSAHHIGLLTKIKYMFFRQQEAQYQSELDWMRQPAAAAIRNTIY